MKTGIELIAEERREQIEKHGRTIESDVRFNSHGELADAAVATLDYDSGYSSIFPLKWDEKIVDHIKNKSFFDRLIIAGALIAAELDRLQEVEK